MGRYYFGQISGKFWFGIQSSDDANHFGVNYQNITVFHVCNCGYEDRGEDNAYCSDCFDSFDQHIEAMKEDEIEDEKTWYESETEIMYHFEYGDKPKVVKKIQELEEIVGKYMEHYKIQDTDNEITYDYVLPENVPEEDLSIIARLCLGKQILYCIEEYGRCSFSAEC